MFRVGVIALAIFGVGTWSLARAQEADQRASQWRERVRAGASALPGILQQLNTADPTAANWLRTAFEAIAEKELAQGRGLDKEMLESHLKDKNNSGRSRRLAYEWLVKTDPTVKDRWLPRFIDDPSLELRRDAIADQIAKLPKDQGRKEALGKVLLHARDRDQVDWLAKELKALGVEVNLAEHFGFIRQWALLSTFDNTDGKGFAAVYSPEQKLDWQSPPAGKLGSPTAWRKATTSHPYGKVDLNKELPGKEGRKQKASVAYAVATFQSDQAARIEVRASCINAIKVWLNGKEVIAHEEYHHGDPMDQYIGQGEVKVGQNQLLVKVCQNDQSEVWAQEWSFAVRLCDSVGTPIPYKLVPPPLADTPAKSEK